MCATPILSLHEENPTLSSLAKSNKIREILWARHKLRMCLFSFNLITIKYFQKIEFESITFLCLIQVLNKYKKLLILINIKYSYLCYFLFSYDRWVSYMFMKTKIITYHHFHFFTFLFSSIFFFQFLTFLLF